MIARVTIADARVLIINFQCIARSPHANERATYMQFICWCCCNNIIFSLERKPPRLLVLDYVGRRKSVYCKCARCIHNLSIYSYIRHSNAVIAGSCNRLKAKVDLMHTAATQAHTAGVYKYGVYACGYCLFCFLCVLFVYVADLFFIFTLFNDYNDEC